MNILIRPKKLKGSIGIVSSKSEAHRVIIGAALAERETAIKIRGISRDIRATVEAVRQLGAEVSGQEGEIVVTPGGVPRECAINAWESGSTIRFILPVAMALCDSGTFTGEGMLPKRPLLELLLQMEQHGCVASAHYLPLTVRGRLKSGVYTVPGDISSQYITGLLLALPLTDGDSAIILTSPLQSKPYVDMTIDTLKKFGIVIREEKERYLVQGNSRYKSPGSIELEGDWSAAAFWLTANFLGSNINVSGVGNSLQGDRRIVDMLRTMRGGLVIDAAQIPDLVPILSVAAAACRGSVKIVNAYRLTLKESNRIETTVRMLKDLGGNVEESADGLIIHGTGRLRGGTCEGFGDHRIVMSAAIASLICERSVSINGAEAVSKSYPAFWDEFKRLGGDASVF